MRRGIKTFLNTLLVVALLLSADAAVSLATRESLIPHISLYSFIEGAILMAAAGLVDLGDSALGASIRRGLFRTGEEWSYKKYSSGTTKVVMLLSGVTLFVLSIIMVL